MILGIITILTSLAMATVAAVFSIHGIVALFAGLPLYAVVMGAVIELGKVVGISWLYRNWSEPTKIKYLMMPVVFVAMMLTSMGIFGLLSKAHLDQTSPVATNVVQIERLEQQIEREQRRITDAETVIAQLDQTVDALIRFERIRGPEGAIAVREAQSDQRALLNNEITAAQTVLDTLQDEKLALTQELRAVELEVGPVKYIAELVYNDGSNRVEDAVRWVIVAFVFVLDPMAILLLTAGNYSLAKTARNAPKPPAVPVVVPLSQQTTTEKRKAKTKRTARKTPHVVTFGQSVDPVAPQPIPSGDSFPLNPKRGETFHRTVDGILYQFDGSNWIAKPDRSEI